MSQFPMPGSPVRGSSTGKPLMALLDLLGRNWTIGVLWHLCESGPASFRELQSRCEAVSPTVLNKRLKELKQAGFVESSRNGYTATNLGRKLFEQLTFLRQFSRQWAKGFDKLER